MQDSVRWPRLIAKPEAKRVAILVPHMDDEVIGCGGVICKHAAERDTITAIYFTDGGKGMPEKSASCELVEIRKREAEAAGKILGITRSVFLDLADGTDVEQDWREMDERLTTVLREERVELIYVPSEKEMHPDHRKTAWALARVLGALGACQVAKYEVWSPLAKPNVIINISRQMPLKAKALRAYNSQLRLMRYDRIIFGLGAYRAGFMPSPAMRFAEAFELADSREYLQDLKFMEAGNV